VSRKSFTEDIKSDFRPPSFQEEEEGKARARAKPFPGARLIPLSEIVPDPNQPRKSIGSESLEELAQSIGSKGVIEPITVRFIEGDGNYRIVTGERRSKAAKMAGLSEIPCIVKEMTEQEALLLQIIENLQREDLKPIEEAHALKSLLENGMTQAQASKQIGKSQPYISQAIKILDLPEAILEEAEKMETSKEALLQLAKAENPEELWKEIKEGGATAKDIKKKIGKEKKPKGKAKSMLWTWKPEDKAFTVSISFKKKSYDKGELIEALKRLLSQLKHEESAKNK
jgi:ParB family chromosome partitioning protein